LTALADPGIQRSGSRRLGGVISNPGERAVEAYWNRERLRGWLRNASDKATVGSFGAITWPWLLRSLGGGGEDSRAALIERTGLPADTFGTLGSWRADSDTLLAIADRILDHRPRMIVEFGGGLSTLVAAHCLQRIGGGRLISFDADAAFAQHTRDQLARHGLHADVHAVPLVAAPEGLPGYWYDHGPLPDRIDLVIVDGPPWFLHPLGRGAAEAVFGAITPGGAVILDDAARPGERMVARRWRRNWPGFRFRYQPGAAGVLIGERG